MATVNYTNIGPEDLSSYGVTIYKPYSSSWEDDVPYNWYNTLEFDSVTANTTNNTLVCKLYYQLRAKYSNTTNISGATIPVTFELRPASNKNKIIYTTSINVSGLIENNDVISPSIPVELIIPSNLSTYDFFITYTADMTYSMSGGLGIYWEWHSTYIEEVRGAALLNVEKEAEPILKQPPTMSTLTNANMYKSQSGVSASYNSIKVAWSATTKSDDKCTAVYYKCVKSGSSSSTYTKVSVSSTNSGNITISGLTEHTTYVITVYAQNSTGNSGTKSITIRTRYAPPVVSCTASEIHIDEALISWTSNKNLVTVQYQLDGGSWITSQSNANVKSGTINLENITYNSSHTIKIKGVATAAYDDQNSNTASHTFTTLDITRLTSIDTLIFGLQMSFNFLKPNTSKCTVLLTLLKYDGTYIEDKTEVTTESSAISNPDQSMLDSIYKLFKYENTQTITAKISTRTNYNTYDDTEQTATLTLTGIAKTGHYGVDNTPKRVQFFIGDVNGKAQRAVCWVGIENKGERTL